MNHDGNSKWLKNFIESGFLATLCHHYGFLLKKEIWVCTYYLSFPGALWGFENDIHNKCLLFGVSTLMIFKGNKCKSLDYSKSEIGPLKKGKVQSW